MKKMSERRASLLIASTVLLGGLAGLLHLPEEGYSFPEPLKTVDVGTTDLSERAIVAGEDFFVHQNGAGRTNLKDEQLEVDETFTSNLPIVLIDTDGVRPPAHAVWSDELNSFLTREDIDPYITGKVSVLDGKNKTTCLSDDPVLESAVRLRRRGNSSVNYDKHQYLLKLTNDAGGSNNQDVLGMGADDEWVLNGSFIDKSLLRNYLAYTLIREIMPYTPDSRFCEVVWKDGGRYKYEGLYLVIENVTVGKNRVDLPAFSENSTYLPFLLRRDRYDPNGVMLDNYSTRNDLLYGRLDIKWPGKTTLSEFSIQRITNQIDSFEEVLFAEDYSQFSQYKDYIDMGSFVDYFVLNEFLISYDAGNNSTYLYSDYSGKLTMGPVWDFDGTMDNYRYEEANLHTTAFHNAPWFRQMLRDPEFTWLIVERYRELRQSILSDKAIQSFIDQTIEGLGSAIDRDWARWGYYYQAGGYLKSEYPGLKDRNTKTHAEEVEKLKTVLSQHGAWMDAHLDSLYQFSDPNAPQISPESEGEHRWGSPLAAVFVIAFFISVTLIQRLERGD